MRRNRAMHILLTTMRDPLVKIGAKIVRHGRSVTFQMAEVMVSRGCSSRYSMPSRRCVHCRRHDVEWGRRGWPTGLSVGDARPDVGWEGRIRSGTANTSPITRHTARSWDR
jgi:hypothetical protein